MSGLPALPMAAMWPPLMRDVGLDDTPVVDDQRIGDHRVGDFGGDLLALPHAVADHLAATELDLVAINGEILLDLDPQIGVGEADAVADGWPEHFGIGLARDADAHSRAPMTAAVKP
jgi:hypothetical protein